MSTNFSTFDSAPFVSKDWRAPGFAAHLPRRLRKKHPIMRSRGKSNRIRSHLSSAMNATRSGRTPRSWNESQPKSMATQRALNARNPFGDRKAIGLPWKRSTCWVGITTFKSRRFRPSPTIDFSGSVPPTFRSRLPFEYPQQNTAALGYIPGNSWKSHANLSA